MASAGGARLKGTAGRPVTAKEISQELRLKLPELTDCDDAGALFFPPSNQQP